jgi:phosphoserine phosphatase RsbU/P
MGLSSPARQKMSSTPQLYWVGPDGQENVIPLVADEVLIGRRSDADIVLNNQHVSRHHLKLVKLPEGYFLKDLGSTHGTFVNEARVEQHLLKNGDRISLGKDRIDLEYIVGERQRRIHSAETTQIFERSLIDLGAVLPSEVSDLEKISCILDFQYQWENLFTPDAAFQKIIQSALKISGAEQGFVLVRDGEGYGYAAGMDAKFRTLSQSHFRTSHTIVDDVVKSGNAVFMVEGLDIKYKEQASIVAMNVRAVACLPLMGIPSEADTPIILGILYLDSTKPMHSLSGLDEKILNKLAVEAGNVLERVEMIKSIEERKKMEQELTLAEETQRTLLPQVLPEVPNLNLHAFSKPTRYVGGDFYDFVKLETGVLAAVLADVSGKGISASLLSSMILGCLQMQLRAHVSTHEAVNRLNQFLCEKSSASRFVTMILFTLDANGRGSYINAGHNTAYIFRAAAGDIEEVPSNNLLVGAFSFAQYQSLPIQLGAGDVLVAYSDGLTEAENKEGEAFGEERLKSIIRAEARSGSTHLEQKVLEAIQDFTMGRSQTDDITIIIVERTR